MTPFTFEVYRSFHGEELTSKGGVFIRPVPEYVKTVLGVVSLKEILIDLSEVIVTVFVVEAEESSLVPPQ